MIFHLLKKKSFFSCLLYLEFVIEPLEEFETLVHLISLLHVELIEPVGLLEATMLCDRPGQMRQLAIGSFQPDRSFHGSLELASSFPATRSSLTDRIIYDTLFETAELFQVDFLSRKVYRDLEFIPLMINSNKVSSTMAAFSKDYSLFTFVLFSVGTAFDAHL